MSGGGEGRSLSAPVRTEKISSGEIVDSGAGAADTWLNQLRSGALSPESAFAGVQATPSRKRPQALQALLQALSGDQILALLVDDARCRAEGRASVGLSAFIARVAPRLPGFAHVCLGDLLRHPTGLQEHAGLDCALGLIIVSPAADEAISAFFDAGEDAVCSLLKWVLRSPGSPALVELLCDILKRLDCARCGQGESKDCVIDLLVELAQQSCWSTLETVRLTNFLSSLREATFQNIIWQCDTAASRGLLSAAAAARTHARGTPGLKRNVSGATLERAFHKHVHKHVVDSLLVGLSTDFEHGSRSAVFFRELVMTMSLIEIGATLELLESKAVEGGCSGGVGGMNLQGRAGVQLLARAAHLKSGGDDGKGGGCAIRVSRGQVASSVSCLVQTAAAQGYLSISLPPPRTGMGGSVGGATSGCRDGEPGGSATVADVSVKNGEAFLDACAALALLTSPASDCPAARQYALCMLDSVLAVAKGVERRRLGGENERGAEDSASGEDFRFFTCAGGEGHDEMKARDAVLKMAEQKAVGAVLLAIASLRDSDQDSGKQRMIRVLQLLMAVHDDQAGEVGDNLAPDFAEALRILITLSTAVPLTVRPPLCSTQEHGKAQDAVEGTTERAVGDLISSGLFVCISRILFVMPRCLWHASLNPCRPTLRMRGFGAVGGGGGSEGEGDDGGQLLEDLLQCLLDHISDLGSDATTAHRDATSGAKNAPERPQVGQEMSSGSLSVVSPQRFGAALSAIAGLVAALMRTGSLSAASGPQANGQIGRGFGVQAFLRVCTACSGVALRLCQPQSGTRSEQITLLTLEEQCRGYAGSSVQYCRGVADLGLLLAAVIKGTDDGSWCHVPLCPAHASDSIGARDKSADGQDVLPEPLLLHAKREVEDKCHGRMLGILTAICRCSSMAREAEASALLRAIFRKRIDRKSLFLRMYVEHALFAAAEESGAILGGVQGSASAEADMKAIWETLFWSARRLSQHHPASTGQCQLAVVSAIAFCLQHQRSHDMPDRMLAPLMRARPVRVLLEYAHAPAEPQNRKNALMALAELVGIGGGSPGIAESDLLWSLLEQEILYDSIKDGQVGGEKGGLAERASAKGLLRILHVCQARISDCSESVWSGFDFAMSVFRPLCCPRIHDLVAPQQVAALRMEHEKDTSHITDSATEDFTTPVYSLIASFVCRWARTLVKRASACSDCQEAASILSLEDNLDEHGCQHLLPVLFELLQALWNVVTRQTPEFLLRGGSGCALISFLQCLLQSNDSICDILKEFGLEQVKGYINRIMVEYAFNPRESNRGGECLGRERRDKLCGFIEKLEKARFCAPTHQP